MEIPGEGGGDEAAASSITKEPTRLSKEGRSYEALIEAELQKDEDGGAANKEDWSQVSLEDRFASTKWEAKVHAVKEISEIWSEKVEEEVKIWIPKVISCLRDKNMAVQKEAIEGFTVILKQVVKMNVLGLWEQSREAICLQTLLSQPRFQAITCELVATFVEKLEGTPAVIDYIVAELLKYRDKGNKVTIKGPATKTVLGLIYLINFLLKSFGVPAVNIASLLEVPKTFILCTDRSIKDGVYDMTAEIFRWTRSLDLAKTGIEAKQVISQIEKRCAELENEPKPVATRTTTLGVLLPMKDVLPGLNKAALDASSPSDVDIFNMIPGVDIFESVNLDKWERDLKELSKWNERKAHIENIIAGLGTTKKIKVTKQTGNCVKHVFTVLTTVFSFDSNVALQATCVTVAEEICRCLRSEMSAEVSKTFVHTIIPKLKDKSKVLQTNILSAMTTFLQIVPLEFYLDDILKCSKDKNPVIKQVLLQWVDSTLASPFVPKPMILKLAKRLIALSVDTIDDQHHPVRTASAALLMSLSDYHSSVKSMVAIAIEPLKGKKKQIMHEVIDRLKRTSIGTDSPTSTSPTSRPALNNADNKPEALSSAQPPKDTQFIPQPPEPPRSQPGSAARRSSLAVTVAKGRGRSSGTDALHVGGGPHKGLVAKRLVADNAIGSDGNGAAESSGDSFSLSSRVSPQLLAELADADWNIRRVRIQEVLDVLSLVQNESAGHTQSELASVLRNRLNTETNRIVGKLVLEASGALCSAIAPSPVGRQCGKILIPALLLKIGDRSNQIVQDSRNALVQWCRFLGVFNFVHAVFFPTGIKAPAKLAPDRKQLLYTLLDENLDNSVLCGDSPHSINPEKLSILPFVQLLCHDVLTERSAALKDVIYNLIEKLLWGLNPSELYQIKTEINSSPPLREVIEIVTTFCQKLMLEKESLNNTNDQFVHHGQHMNVSKHDYQVHDSSEQQPGGEDTMQTRESSYCVITPPTSEEGDGYMTNQNPGRMSWPVQLTSRNLQELAQACRGKVTDSLLEAMFPELFNSSISRAGRLKSALEFWLGVLEMDPNANAPERLPCSRMEDRLGALPEYQKVCNPQKGFIDLLFRWCIFRLSDATQWVQRSVAKILQQAGALLIAAQSDAKCLIKLIEDEVREENREFTEDEIYTINVLSMEGKLSHSEIEILLLHLLDKSLILKDDLQATVQDVLLASAYLTSDPPALFQTTLKIAQRIPEVLELTSFMIEQDGWRICQDPVTEIIELSRFCMNPECSENPMTWAAQGIALILLSMTKPDAVAVLTKMEEAVPGIKKFVSKFIRSHSDLLTIFPPQGLPPHDPAPDDRMHLDAQMGNSSPVTCDGLAAARNTTDQNYQGPNRSPKTLDGDENMEVADEGSATGQRLRDALEEFDMMVKTEALEKTINEALETTDTKRFSMRLRNAQLTLQDFLIELRKEKEGRNFSIEQEIRYWNAVRRLEYVQKASECKHVTIVVEASKLSSGELIEIKEAAINLERLLVASYQKAAAQSRATGSASDSLPSAVEHSKPPMVEWPVVFAGELVTACASALNTVFKQEVIQRGIQFREIAEAVTSFTHELVRNRRVLYPVSPAQLKTLFKAVFAAMASHIFWQGIIPADTLVRQLNDIMGNQLMSIVSPRTAGSLVEACFEFIISYIYGDDDENTDPLRVSQLDYGLFSRTFKRLIKKLHSKYPLPAKKDTFNLGESNSQIKDAAFDEHTIYPLSGHDKLNYLRLLDIALSCLLLMEIKLPDPPFPNETEDPAVFDFLGDNNSELRRELRICLRELFIVLFIYCPHLCGIYFRDKKYSSQHELRQTIADMTDINKSTSDIKDNMFIPPPQLMFASYVHHIIRPNLSRSDTTSFVLERLMNDTNLDAHEESLQRAKDDEMSQTIGSRNDFSTNPSSSETMKDINVSPDIPFCSKTKKSFFELHAEFTKGKGSKTYNRTDIKAFYIDEFIKEAPERITLKTLDSTLAAGWARRRDLIYAGEDASGVRCQPDVIPMTELMKSWKTRIAKLKSSMQNEKAGGGPTSVGEVSELEMSLAASSSGLAHQVKSSTLLRLALKYINLNPTTDSTVPSSVY